jgi:3-hydroxypropanoate dehydrogenase
MEVMGMSIPASSMKESVASFDHGAGVMDSDFSVTTRIKSNFTCCLGYGSNEHRFPPNPRSTFEEAGRFA